MITSEIDDFILEYQSICEIHGFSILINKDSIIVDYDQDIIDALGEIMYIPKGE